MLRPSCCTSSVRTHFDFVKNRVPKVTSGERYAILFPTAKEMPCVSEQLNVKFDLSELPCHVVVLGFTET